MSVPPPYKTTPDQGWSAMRTVLDREMPVRRRRRAVFWLWPLLLAGGVLTTWWWASGRAAPAPAEPAKNTTEVPAIAMPGQAGTPATPEADNPDMAIATQTEQPAQTDKHNTTSDAGSPSASAGSHYQEPARRDVVKSTAAGSRPAAPLAANDPTSSDGVSAGIPAKGETNPNPQITRPDYLNETESGNTNPEPEAATSIPMAGTKALHPASPAMTDPLPLAEVMLGVPGVEPEMQATPALAIASPRRPVRLQPFIYGAGQTGIQMGSGYQVGAGTELAFSRRFSLSASLGYHAYRPQGSLFPGQKEEADLLGNASPIVVEENFGQTGNSMVIPVNNLSGGLSHDALVPLVESVNQWQWHLGATLRAGTRWSFESGLGLGWGTRATSRFPIVTYADIGSADVVRSTDQLHEFGLVKRTTASWYVGAAYSPVHRLEIFGRWSAAMTDYLTLSNQLASFDVSTRDDRINTLQAGIRLRLGS